VLVYNCASINIIVLLVTRNQHTTKKTEGEEVNPDNFTSSSSILILLRDVGALDAFLVLRVLIRMTIIIVVCRFSEHLM
jgi:hypothetical protein